MNALTGMIQETISFFFLFYSIMPFNPGNKDFRELAMVLPLVLLVAYLVYLTEEAVLSLSQTDLY